MIELKGFQALRQLNELNNQKTPVEQQISILPIEKLQGGQYQPRTSFNEQELQDLSSSIKEQGIIQPLIVRKVNDVSFEIIAGERRWRAAKMAGLSSVPAIIREIDDSVALAFALIENIQRQDLNAIEEARAYERFRKDFNMTHDEIGSYVGKSRATISNSLRLLKLPSDILNLVEHGELDMGHARCLLTLDCVKQREIIEKILSNSLSVRETEKLASQVLNSNDANLKTNDSPRNFDKLNLLITESIGFNARIKSNDKGKGRLVIDFNSEDELDKLIKEICRDELFT